jgi:hypothetical protein
MSKSDCVKSPKCFETKLNFWELGVLVKEALDWVNFKFNFRRTVDNSLMNQWLELVQIATSIQFMDEQDAII